MRFLRCASCVWVASLVTAACAWAGDGWREFRSAEGGKSLVGQVVSYDPAKHEVTVRKKGGGGQVKLGIDQQGKTVRTRIKPGSYKGKTTTRIHPDARARDTLVGCVVWIKVGGETANTEASSPALLGCFGKPASR